ncbi:MAG: tRNA pseudouridine(55) synthase TruB [Cytophagaceae bacterium]|nr:tRNA pseudouridine(55) synthase TruB [Gemmatimonadaceae bacterium]
MSTTSTDALVLVDKPAGVTSFDAVRAVTRAIGIRKAGHTGTLDPFATGLLVVLTGAGTRLIRFVPGEPKVYLATIRFGEERDTDDRTGTVSHEAALPERAAVMAAVPCFVGTLSQVPPDYSAKKVEGRRAYAMARGGAPADLAPVSVRVDAWDVVSLSSDAMVARIACGGGTYIRALARDLGRAVGSAAHLAELRRERCGPFHVDQATTLERLREGDTGGRPLTEALGDVAREVLGPEETARVTHGMTVVARAAGERALLVDGDGHLLAVAHRADDRWQPDVVLAHA